MVEVIRNDPAGRYEARVDGELAGILEYRGDDTRVLFTHTETFPEYRNHGIAGALTKVALDDAHAEHRGVVPACSYVARYIQDHPEYIPDVVEQLRSQYD